MQKHSKVNQIGTANEILVAFDIPWSDTLQTKGAIKRSRS